MRGDVIQLLGFDGVVDKTYDYDAYGNEYARDLGDENPFRYCGEYYDTETGFIYLRARYYDPMVGRFTSVDPVKDGLNWYAYCEGNPIKYVDPSGESPLVVFALVALYGIGYYTLTGMNYVHNNELEKDLQTSTRNQMIIGQQNERYSRYALGVYADGSNTCEAIAVHNAKVYLEIESTLSQTIYDTQMCGGMWLYGFFGSHPQSLGYVLDKYDINYTYISSISEITNEGMYIISYVIDGEIQNGIHTVALEFDGENYYEYNYDSDIDYAKKIDLNDYKDWLICGFYVGTRPE